jgi:hypothetical protein
MTYAAPTATRCLIFVLTAFALPAQQTPPSNQGSVGGGAVVAPSMPYSPPTHAQKFDIFIHHTFGPDAIFMAAVWAAIDQAEHSPSQWPEGAEGFAERFGSVMGRYAVRGATEYTLSEAFREDLRYVHCFHCSVSGKLKDAVLNTFAARKGQDGHEDLSVARLLAPIPTGVVASTWLPGKYDAHSIANQVAFTYAFDLTKNVIVELVRR